MIDATRLREEEAEYIEETMPHKKIKVKDAMIKPIILHQDDEIETIIKKLKNEKHNYCIVVDDNENFLGEISIEKLIKLIAHNSINEPLVKILDIGFKRKINYTTAKDHIKKHKNFVYEDNSILDVLKLIDKRNSKYIPVLNNEKKVVGLITPSSLLNLLNKH
jgi:osmoprotectant transport system ATP-binding protein